MDDKAPWVQIAHVLFLDVVGYSRETTQAQGRLRERLDAAVTGTKAFSEARRRVTPCSRFRPMAFFARTLDRSRFPTAT